MLPYDQRLGQTSDANILKSRRSWKNRMGRILREKRISNRGAFLIDQSVIKGGYAQSYVESSVSFWLSDLFENEKKLSSMENAFG